MKTRKIVAVGAMLAILVASYFTDKAPAAVRVKPSQVPIQKPEPSVHGPLAGVSWSGPLISQHKTKLSGPKFELQASLWMT